MTQNSNLSHHVFFYSFTAFENKPNSASNVRRRRDVTFSLFTMMFCFAVYVFCVPPKCQGTDLTITDLSDELCVTKVYLAAFK